MLSILKNVTISEIADGHILSAFKNPFTSVVSEELMEAEETVVKLCISDLGEVVCFNDVSALLLEYKYNNKGERTGKCKTIAFRSVLDAEKYVNDKVSKEGGNVTFYLANAFNERLRSYENGRMYNRTVHLLSY